jgi:CRISPR-associated endonuclease Cas2
MIRQICYDISEDKVRTRLSKFLEAQDFTRLQYSVFVGQIEPSRWKTLERYLAKFHEKYCDAKDRINSHVIERDNFQEMLILGNEVDTAWILHEITVLFI